MKYIYFRRIQISVAYHEEDSVYSHRLLSVSAVANARVPVVPRISSCSWWMIWDGRIRPYLWIQKTHYNEVYETPNMERLAKGGMMFTQAYASSISSPTRCSLITGTNAARHRVTNWTLFKDKTTDRESDVLTLPDWNYNGVAQVGGTNNTFVGTSFVQILKNNGYHTIHCGKAHFGRSIPRGRTRIIGDSRSMIAGHAPEVSPVTSARIITGIPRW